MRLEFEEFFNKDILVFSDKDRCRYCLHSDKCPLIHALDNYYIVSTDGKDIPTRDFCELYEPNDLVMKLEKDLTKGKKTRER